MRIALFTETFLPKIDGIVTRLTKTLEQLDALGHEVLIFAPGRPPKTFGSFEVVAVPSVPFFAYPEVKFGIPWPKDFQRLREFDPDVIHAVNPVWTAGCGVLAAKALNIPLVASFHTNVPEYTEELGIAWLKKPAATAINFLHNQAQINLCTSGPMVDKARGLGMKNVELWPKAVDTVTYHPDKATEQMRSLLSGGNPNAPVVSYIGRISKEKHLHELSNIMELVRERVPNARLAMVGSGPNIEQLKHEFKSDFCTFTGYLSGDDLSAAFASSDVFVFPSRTETLGLVALESMASNVPVIGARAGGIPFVLDDQETGFLIEPAAPLGVHEVPQADIDVENRSWADAIVTLLTDDSLRERMGKAGREEALRHSWLESTRSVVDVYERAIVRKDNAMRKDNALRKEKA